MLLLCCLKTGVNVLLLVKCYVIFQFRKMRRTFIFYSQDKGLYTLPTRGLTSTLWIRWSFYNVEMMFTLENTHVKFASRNTDLNKACLVTWWSIQGNASLVPFVITNLLGCFLSRLIWKKCISSYSATHVLRHLDCMKAARIVAQTCELIFWLRDFIQQLVLKQPEYLWFELDFIRFLFL